MYTDALIWRKIVKSSPNLRSLFQKPILWSILKVKSRSLKVWKKRKYNFRQNSFSHKSIVQYHFKRNASFSCDLFFSRFSLKGQILRAHFSEWPRELAEHILRNSRHQIWENPTSSTLLLHFMTELASLWKLREQPLSHLLKKTRYVWFISIYSHSQWLFYKFVSKITNKLVK